uniref:FYVE-type domain-containing protein n=1 Tax=Phytophthora ramorum TaxID=164328 RepID=H3GR26_PHYRM
MGKDRFVVNPFDELNLSSVEKDTLRDFGHNFIDQNIEKYEEFISNAQRQVDQTKWKLIKTKDDTRVYLDRDPLSRSSGEGDKVDPPEILVTGTTWGTVDDFMYGAVNPTIEAMRIKATYVEDMSGGAVLASLDDPTVEEPFKSMNIKWMELDLPFASTPLIKNRDYIFLECTKYVHLSNGERVGVMTFHSVNFPETKELPGRVRASITVCCIARQVDPDRIEVYGSGFVDPAGDMIKALVMPTIATGYLTMLKYTECSNMKKMTKTLEKRYAISKELGAPNRPKICITCTKPMSKLRIGDYSKSRSSTCKLCAGYLCRSCRLQRKLAFVGADHQLEMRKVSFCGVCLQNVRSTSPLEAAREDAMGPSKRIVYFDSSLTSSSVSS